MKEPRGQELVDRYKAYYHIPSDSVITEEMVLSHWKLERRLTEELLASTPDNRWEVFEKCYSTLFSELAWLNQLIDTDSASMTSSYYPMWKSIIGRPPMKIYEVGSGKANLILYLAEQGFECRATEITRERGEKWAATHPNLTWGISDGVHLDRFETANSYDVVISNQVIEHMHPDDVPHHFKAVSAILSDKGRYLFTVAHASIGPKDVSRVFGCEKPMGMHLKEYTYGETIHLLHEAGFRQVSATLTFPQKLSRLLRRNLSPRASASYMSYLRFLETLIMAMPRQSLRQKLAETAKIIRFHPTSLIVAEKQT